MTEKPTALKITLSNWVYEGIVNEKSLLTMHQDYFLISGGLERALYRIARKHAGDQETGWTCRVSVLDEKSGSDSAPKEFNRMLRKIIDANELPDYETSFVTAGDGSPAVHFLRRTAADRAKLRAELEAEANARLKRAREDARAIEVDQLGDRFASRRVLPQSD